MWSSLIHCRSPFPSFAAIAAADARLVAAATQGSAGESLSRAQARRGMHKAVLQLTRVLREGRAVKEELDLVIDLCGAVHNIRDVVAVAMEAEEKKPSRAEDGLSRAGKYLETYVLLICFNAYLRERR